MRPLDLQLCISGADQADGGEAYGCLDRAPRGKKKNEWML